MKLKIRHGKRSITKLARKMNDILLGVGVPGPVGVHAVTGVPGHVGVHAVTGVPGLVGVHAVTGVPGHVGVHVVTCISLATCFCKEEQMQLALTDQTNFQTASIL